MNYYFIRSFEKVPNLNYFLFRNDYENTFLVASVDHFKQEYNINYEFQNPIYLWKGSHFDIFQYIFSSNSKKIVSFQIGASSFLAIANYKNNYGEILYKSNI